MEVASAVLLQAIEDWQILCKGKEETSDINFNELRSFFRSEWAENLCGHLGISPKKLLAKLEEQRKESEQKRLTNIELKEQK
jgi:hypothetical protein